MYVPLVSYQFYTDEYRAGMDNPPISENAWGFLERTAWNTINWRNIPLDEFRIDNGDFPEYLKLAISAVAELEQQRSKAPKAGDIVSETAFSYSIKLKDVKDKNEFNQAIRSVIANYIFGTPLHSQIVHKGI